MNSKKSFVKVTRLHILTGKSVLRKRYKNYFEFTANLFKYLFSPISCLKINLELEIGPFKLANVNFVYRFAH